MAKEPPAEVDLRAIAEADLITSDEHPRFTFRAGIATSAPLYKDLPLDQNRLKVAQWRWAELTLLTSEERASIAKGIMEKRDRNRAAHEARSEDRRRAVAENKPAPSSVAADQPVFGSADAGYWSRIARWTINQATALWLNKDPNQLSEGVAKRDARQNETAADFLSRRC